jgi:hypothetical protein
MHFYYVLMCMYFVEMTVLPAEKVTFLRHGQLHDTNHLIQVTLQYPLSPFVNSCGNWAALLQKRMNDHNATTVCSKGEFLPVFGCSLVDQEDLHSIQTDIHQAAVTVETACTQVKSWPGVATLEAERTTHSGTSTPIVKRQVAAYIAAFSLGTLMGQFTKLLGLGQTGHALQLAEQNELRLNHLDDIVSHLGKAVGIDLWRSETTKLSLAAEHFARTVQEVTHGIDVLYTQRFPLGFLSGIDFDKLYFMLDSKAKAAGGSLPFDSMDQLFQFPTRFLPDASTQSLQITVHIPVTRNVYDVLYLQDKHVVSGENDDLVFLEVRHEKPYFVLSSESNRFLELSDNQLSSCIQMGNKFFGHLEFLQSNFSESCLAGLYQGNFQTISELCNLHILRNNWHIAIQPNQVMLFSKSPILLREICTRNSTVRTVQGIVPIKRKVNCSISTEMFQVPQPPTTEVLSTLVVNVDWDTKVLGVPSLHSFQRMQQELAAIGIVPEQHLHKLRLQYARQSQHDAKMRWLIVLSSCASIFCALACVLFSYTFYIAWNNTHP